MICVNCGRAEATTAWDSLAFNRRKSWDAVGEYATGYEKVGLCYGCRRELGRKHWAMVLPKENRILFWTTGVVGALGALLMMLEYFFGYRIFTFVGAAVLVGSLTLGYVRRNGDNPDSTLIGVGSLLGIAGALAAVASILSASGRSQVSPTGWAGYALLIVAAGGYFIGARVLKGRAAKGDGPLEALLLGKVEAENHRYVPLGEGLYADKKTFLRVNSLLDKNEEQVYDEFIATGRWRELVEHPERFKFLSLI